MTAARFNYRRVNLASFAVKQTEHDSLSHRASSLDALRSFVRVHIASLSADESFVRFNRASHLVYGSGVHHMADSLKHEPSRTLSYFHVLSKLIRTNSVLAVREKPHSREPLVQTDSAVFENSSDLDRKLFPAFKASPHQPSTDKRESFGITSRTRRTFGPFSFGNSFQAHHRVRKVPDSVHQTALIVELFCFHGLSICLNLV
jgi:hypothetical protein